MGPGSRRSGPAGGHGQALLLVALVLPVFLLALVLLGEVLVTARAVALTAAALDLAVHAGAQTARMGAQGRPQLDPAEAEARARQVYLRNGAPGQLLALTCDPDVCRGQAAVTSPGWALPPQTILVEARAEPLTGIAEGGD